MNDRTKNIIDTLEKTYPGAHCELNYLTPLQLLTATVLSAQTTDKQVNKVTEKLFADHPDLDSMLTLSREEIVSYIRTLGFFNTKADHLYWMWRKLKEDFGGEVPRTMEELTTLPGVGRKTANVVMSNAFDIPAIAVDTHVFRVSNRIGLVHAKDVEHTEQQLRENLDSAWWSRAHHLLIFHGRYCCKAQRPMCEECPIKDNCEHYQKGIN